MMAAVLADLCAWGANSSEEKKKPLIYKGFTEAIWRKR
jgi:hypothetical protein